MTEIHRADPRLRRQAPWWLIASLAGGAIALWLIRGWLNQALAAEQTQALVLVFAGLTILLATGCGALGWSLWSAATRVLAEDRFPPRDMRTLRDVPVHHGAPARNRARAMRVCALGLAAAAVAITVWGLLVLRGFGT